MLRPRREACGVPLGHERQPSAKSATSLPRPTAVESTLSNSVWPFQVNHSCEPPSWLPSSGRLACASRAFQASQRLGVEGNDEERSCADGEHLCPATDNHRVKCESRSLSCRNGY